MSDQGLGDGPLEDVCTITGGTQNIMLRFIRSGRPYVLRRGPKHLRPRSNVVIMRETEVLAALAGTDVPHPAPDRQLRRHRRDRRCGFLSDGAGRRVQRRPGTAGATRHRSGSAFRDGVVDGGVPGQARRGRLCRGGPQRLRQAGWFPGTSSATLAFGAGVVPGVRQLPRPGHPRRRRRRQLARPRPAGAVDAGHHARRLPRRQRDVLPHQPRGRRDRRLGDVHDRRSAARPRLAAGDLGTVRGIRRRCCSRRAGWPPPAIWSSSTPATPPATCRTSPGTPCWHASSSASCWRAPTRGPTPARLPRRSATCSTRPPCNCSSRP